MGKHVIPYGKSANIARDINHVSMASVNYSIEIRKGCPRDRKGWVNRPP